MFFIRKNIPSIDLHALESDIARVVVEDFIKENIILKTQEFVIIHGIGTGVLKKTVESVLYNYRDLFEYGTSNFNQGITLVKLK